MIGVSAGELCYPSLRHTQQQYGKWACHNHQSVFLCKGNSNSATTGDIVTIYKQCNSTYKQCYYKSSLQFVSSVIFFGPPLWSSGQSFWLQIERSRVGSPALPDFLSSSGSGTGSTQPREVKLRSYLNKKVAAPGSENRD